MNSRLATTVMAFFMIVGLICSIGYSLSAKHHKPAAPADQTQSETSQ
jgi:hypothetical protein